MKLRCYLLSFLKLHQPDCDYCRARETCGLDMRKRLEELNGRMRPNSLKKDVCGEVAAIFDCKPCEAIASPSVSFSHKVKKAG